MDHIDFINYLRAWLSVIALYFFVQSILIKVIEKVDERLHRDYFSDPLERLIRLVNEENFISQINQSMLTYVINDEDKDKVNWKEEGF